MNLRSPVLLMFLQWIKFCASQLKAVCRQLEGQSLHILVEVLLHKILVLEVIFPCSFGCCIHGSNVVRFDSLASEAVVSQFLIFVQNLLSTSHFIKTCFWYIDRRQWLVKSGPHGGLRSSHEALVGSNRSSRMVEGEFRLCNGRWSWDKSMVGEPRLMVIVVSETHFLHSR